MKNIIIKLKSVIWVMAIFVSLGIYSEAQAACGTDTVTRNSITYGTVVGADGKCWLDRNLGATRVATSYDDTSAYGWYFQWGRGVDGHHVSTSGVTGTLSSSDTPGHANFIFGFSSGQGATLDWRNPQNNNLWQGVSGINNPCPTGFRLPTQSEWSTLKTAAGINNYASGFNSSLKLTAAGARGYGNGIVQFHGSEGYYWSSSTRITQSYMFYVNSSSANDSYWKERSSGISVRCIGDETLVLSPVVATNAVSSITATTATGNGNVINTGGANPTRQIEWGTVSGAYPNSCTAGTGSTGAYSCSMTGLTPSTTYYFRAKTTNSAGTSYGEESSFTTTAFVCGTDAVSYGGKNYTTVQLGTQCWFRENLNVGTNIADASQIPSDPAPIKNDPNTFQKWCVDNSASKCSTYGGMYTWAEANGLSNACNTSSCVVPSQNQGICPNNWHIPTDDEYKVLEMQLGMNQSQADSIGWRGTHNEGTQMKTNSASTFSNLLGGVRYDQSNYFLGEYDFSFFWTASQLSNSYAWNRSLYVDYNTVYRGSSESGYTKRFGFSVRCIKDMDIPDVVTNMTTDITTATAAGNGNVTATGGANPTRSIEWGTTPGNYATGNCTAGTGSTGTYTCAMTNLTPGTTYYVRAKATNSAGTSYGAETSFTTLSATATVTTSATTNITMNSATLNGNITDIGNDNPERIMEYGTATNTYPNSCTQGTGSTGAYSCNLTNLLPDTTYYYRAKATNSAGTSYGIEQSFQTLPDYITIVDPTPVKMSNAVSSGQVTLSSGTASSTPLVTTNTNIHIQDTVVRMVIPQNTQITNTDSGNFNFQNFIAENAITTVKQTIPNSLSAVKVGVPNTKLTFSQPITLTIDVNPAYNGRTLDVLYQNDGESTWHSQTSCTITGGQCIFQTNHATTYTVNGSGNMVGDTGVNLNTDIQEVISLDCGTSIVNMGNLTPGTPVTGSSTCLTTTNANGGYNLSVQRDDSTDTTMDKTTEDSTNITDKPNWSPSTPNAQTWSGTGLGFTVYDSTANKNTTWWGTGSTVTDASNLYAGFAPAATDIMRHTTYSSLGTTTSIGYKLDVPPSQKSGAYSGAITYQVTTTP